MATSVEKLKNESDNLEIKILFKHPPWSIFRLEVIEVNSLTDLDRPVNLSNVTITTRTHSSPDPYLIAPSFLDDDPPAPRSDFIKLTGPYDTDNKGGEAEFKKEVQVLHRSKECSKVYEYDLKEDFILQMRISDMFTSIVQKLKEKTSTVSDIPDKIPEIAISEIPTINEASSASEISENESILGYIPDKLFLSQYSSTKEAFYEGWEKYRNFSQKLGIREELMQFVGDANKRHYYSSRENLLENHNYLKIPLCQIPLIPIRGREHYYDWKPVTDSIIIKQQMAEYQSYVEKYPHLVKLTQHDFRFNPATVYNYMRKAQEWDALIRESRQDIKNKNKRAPPSRTIQGLGHSKNKMVTREMPKIFQEHQVVTQQPKVFQVRTKSRPVQNDRRGMQGSSKNRKLPHPNSVPRNTAKDMKSRQASINAAAKNDLAHMRFDGKRSYEIARAKVMEDLAREKQLKELRGKSAFKPRN